MLILSYVSHFILLLAFEIYSFEYFVEAMFNEKRVRSSREKLTSFTRTAFTSTTRVRVGVFPGSCKAGVPL